jgi:hypothetical protein
MLRCIVRGSSITVRAVEMGQVSSSRSTDSQGSEAALEGCKSSLLHFV